MSAPTPISSLVHSSTLVTAGILLFVKIVLLINIKISNVLFFISLISLILRSIICYIEKDFKKLVAFSTLSQISYILIAISINYVYMCFFHLYMHAYFKSILFFSVGNILHNMQNIQDKRQYNKILIMSNYNTIIIILSLISIRGLIFISGFFRKEMVIECIFFKNNNYLFFIFIISISLTIIYSFNIFYNFFLISQIKINLLNKSQIFFLNILFCFFFSVFLRI